MSFLCVWRLEFLGQDASTATFWGGLITGLQASTCTIPSHEEKGESLCSFVKTLIPFMSTCECPREMKTYVKEKARIE